MMPTIETIAADPRYFLHHTASRRGYVSRKTPGRLEPYNGKFGHGYVAIAPRWDTTQYVNVAYYIDKAEIAWQSLTTPPGCDTIALEVIACPFCSCSCCRWQRFSARRAASNNPRPGSVRGFFYA